MVYLSSCTLSEELLELENYHFQAKYSYSLVVSLAEGITLAQPERIVVIYLDVSS